MVIKKEEKFDSLYENVNRETEKFYIEIIQKGLLIPKEDGSIFNKKTGNLTEH